MSCWGRELWASCRASCRSEVTGTGLCQRCCGPPCCSCSRGWPARAQPTARGHQVSCTQTDRQTDRQTDSQRPSGQLHVDRQTDRQTEAIRSATHRQTDCQRPSGQLHTDRQTDRQRDPRPLSPVHSLTHALTFSLFLCLALGYAFPNP